MTQFAYFTGKKPEFGNLEFVPLNSHHTRDYIGTALSESEAKETWVINSENSEPLDEMACEAMGLAHSTGTIENSKLFRLLNSYIGSCKTITFVYATDAENIPVYSDPIEFINEITKSLREQSGEVYAKYSAA